MGQSLDLFRLQKIDTQRDQALTRIREIDQILQSDNALRLAQEERSAAESTLNEAHRALREAERAVESQSIKIEQNEASLYGGKVHNPKELQDLQNEVKSLKRYLSVLEDQQLEAMINLEKTEADLQASNARYEDTSTSVQERQASLVTEKQSLARQLERLDAERQATSRSVPADKTATYERLRQAKRGIAVAVIDEDTCSACGHTLTPAECQAARAPSHLSYCPSCGRILYAG